MIDCEEVAVLASIEQGNELILWINPSSSSISNWGGRSNDDEFTDIGVFFFVASQGGGRLGDNTL